MRTVPSIATMTPEQVMRKTPFRIPIPSDAVGFTPYTPGLSIVEPGTIQYELRTQADFAREYNVNSHKINKIKHYPIGLFTNGVKHQAKVRTRIAVGYQEMIKTKRKTALLGNNVGMRLISSRSNATQQDLLARFREGWEESNMEIAIDRAIDSDYITGDCAVYIYMSGGRVGWRSFSYKDGDMLYPHYNPITGELELFGRAYTDYDDTNVEVHYLDVIDSQYFATYRQGSDGKWVLETEPVKHNFPICPVSYHRSIGPVWSASQSLIDNYEVGISQFSENNLSYGLRILYTLGGDFEVTTNADGTPSRIDSTDVNAKVGYLEAAQGADGAFAKQLEILNKNIMRSSFAVETPEIKSGADMSSLTVKMLFADSYLKALEDSQEYQLFLDRVAYLFKYAYGIVSGQTSDFEGFRVKPYLEPFIFMSESEVINALVQLTAAGVLSKESATEIAYNTGYGTANEWERILGEARAELLAQSVTEPAANANVNVVNNSRVNA